MAPSGSIVGCPGGFHAGRRKQLPPAVDGGSSPPQPASGRVFEWLQPDRERPRKAWPDRRTRPPDDLVVATKNLGRALALLGQHREADDLDESGLISGAVKAFVQARALDFREARTGLADQGHGDLIVGEFLHHAVVQDEAVLVCRHRHPQPELGREPALPSLIHSVYGWKTEKTFSAWGMR